MPVGNAVDFAQLDRFERIAALGMASMHPGGLDATLKLADWAKVGPGVRLLDVGCGVGQTSCLLAGQFGARVVGMDRSAGMVARARERQRKEGVGVEFVEGDAYAMPFADAEFQIVFAESVTLFLERSRVLSEIFRVLEPGGVVCDIVMTCREAVPEEFLEQLARLEGVRMYPIPEAEWLQVYRDAGFEIARSEFHPTISDRATLGKFFRDNGPGGLLAALRLAGLFLADAGVRAYMRELGPLWKAHKHLFGYGLIMARRPG